MEQTFRFLRACGAMFKFNVQARMRYLEDKQDLQEKRKRWQVSWNNTQSLPPGSARDEALAQLEAEGEAIKGQEAKLEKEDQAFTYCAQNMTLEAEFQLVAQAMEKAGRLAASPGEDVCVEAPNQESAALIIPSCEDSGPTTLRHRLLHSEPLGST